jgi:hypothetical protein
MRISKMTVREEMAKAREKLLVLRLRWILQQITSELMVDYKLLYDDGKSNKFVELKQARFDHDNKAIILS